MKMPKGSPSLCCSFWTPCPAPGLGPHLGKLTLAKQEAKPDDQQEQQQGHGQAEPENQERKREVVHQRHQRVLHGAYVAKLGQPGLSWQGCPGDLVGWAMLCLQPNCD